MNTQPVLVITRYINIAYYTTVQLQLQAQL